MIVRRLCRSTNRVCWVGVIAMAMMARQGHAQSYGSALSEAWAGSTLESYLRYLQTLGISAAYPMSIRAFSPAELDRLKPADSAHPWKGAVPVMRPDGVLMRWDFLSTRVSTVFNSAFPYGGNDGPEWKGKGITTTIQGGAWLRWSGLSLVFAPVAFRAENKAFPLMPNGESGNLALAHGRFPRNIDNPQRFGRSAYSRLDLGESTLRLDARGIAAGVSTASQWWGPTSDFPVVLGNGAGGFPHVFLGTSRPASVGIGSVHGRVVYGFLEQSRLSPVTGSTGYTDITESGTRRFMAGIVGVMQIRGVPGFEIGGTRFFHAAHDEDGVTSHNLRLPFQGLLKSRLPAEQDTAFGGFQTVRENQLASFFIRIAPPGSGFDLYAEYGREDHSLDARDFLLEPDHSSLVNVGLRKAWIAGTGMTAARIEAFTYTSPGGVRSRLEGQGGAYTHSILRQGHTHRGQMLAADVGPGSGDAQSVVVERFHAAGHWSAYARRAVAHESIERYSDEGAVERAVDVLNTVGGEFTRFHPTVDMTAGAAITYNANRYNLSDKTNLTLSIAARRRW